MSLNRAQARVAAAALAPQVQALKELLAKQVRLLPPGNDDWFRTQERLDLEQGALVALYSIVYGIEVDR
jgi:hypothetical protein